MLKERKEELIGELEAEFKNSTSMIVADYRGLSVKQLAVLRNEIRPHDASFYVAKNTLARIAVSERDIDQVAAQLQGIFALIEQMQTVDTRAVEPMSHAQEVVLRLRPDEVSETDRREQFQAVAPAVEAGLYLVPKVIE